MGALAATEMALALAGIPHKKGGVQAAVDYLDFRPCRPGPRGGGVSCSPHRTIGTFARHRGMRDRFVAECGGSYRLGSRPDRVSERAKLHAGYGRRACDRRGPGGIELRRCAEPSSVCLSTRSSANVLDPATSFRGGLGGRI